MASADRFAEVVEEQIPQIINEAIPINTKRQTVSSPKFVDFGNARFENCNFAFTYIVSKKSDWHALNMLLAISLTFLWTFSAYETIL